MADEESKKGGVDPVITKMLDRFKLSSEAEATNRKDGLLALKFRTGGDNQWDQNILNLRSSDNRPSESYNQIPQFVHQVTNDMRMNMPQVRFIPGNEGTKEVAEVYEDLARNIQSSSEAEVALDTAADFQVTIGWGYARVLTDYENETTFDQIIKIGWVPNPFTIYDDPHALMQDRSDRKFLIQVCDIPVDDFNDEYDKKYSAIELSSIGDSQPDWATEDTVRIAEYWTLEEKKTKLYRKKGEGKIMDVVPAGYSEDDYDSRYITECKVKWRKCSALEVLEEREWAGKYIPYIFVSGEELNIDGKKQLSGIVRYMIAPQKQYNYWTNAATEMVALAPKAPYIMALGQVEGLEKFWDNANVKSYPYLPYKPISINGTAVGAPQRQQAEAPIQAMMSMVQQAQQNMYTTTGIYPASLGRQGNETSGKAIIARQREGDVSTFHFSDNMARAIRFMGRILADLIPKIYDAPRALTLLKEDKTNYEVRINEPYVDKQTGEERNLDLTVGTYDIAVSTGPSYTTKRQESAETMTQLVQADPTLMQKAPDLIVSSYDFPGAEKLAERLKKFLPPGIADEPKKGDIPPEVQMQMQQMQQMVEQLTQTVQQQAQELESKKADVMVKQADLQLKQQDMMAKGQSDQLKAEIDKMKLELEAAKLEFEKTKLATETQMGHAKMELDKLKMRLDAKASASPDAVMIDPEFHDGAEPPMVTMMNQMATVLTQGLQQVAQITAQSSDAIVQSNVLLAQGNQQIAEAINAPKQVIRDPQTNLISGVM